MTTGSKSTVTEVYWFLLTTAWLVFACAWR